MTKKSLLTFGFSCFLAGAILTKLLPEQVETIRSLTPSDPQIKIVLHWAFVLIYAAFLVSFGAMARRTYSELN